MFLNKKFKQKLLEYYKNILKNKNNKSQIFYFC